MQLTHDRSTHVNTCSLNGISVSKRRISEIINIWPPDLYFINKPGPHISHQSTLMQSSRRQPQKGRVCFVSYTTLSQGLCHDMAINYLYVHDSKNFKCYTL